VRLILLLSLREQVNGRREGGILAEGARRLDAVGGEALVGARVGRLEDELARRDVELLAPQPIARPLMSVWFCVIITRRPRVSALGRSFEMKSCLYVVWYCGGNSGTVGGTTASSRARCSSSASRQPFAGYEYTEYPGSGTWLDVINSVAGVCSLWVKTRLAVPVTSGRVVNLVNVCCGAFGFVVLSTHSLYLPVSTMSRSARSSTQLPTSVLSPVPTSLLYSR